LFLSNKESVSKQSNQSIKVRKTGAESSDEISLESLSIPEKIDIISQKILVDGIIRPRLEEIAQYLKEDLARIKAPVQTPAGIILTGGGALTPYLLETIKKELKMPVRIGLPQELEGVSDELRDPRFAALVGALQYTVTQPEETPRLSIPNLGKVFKNFEVKEGLQKTIEFFKSFIPGAK